MRTFTLGTMLWSIAVIAACFAAYRVDFRAAPLIATMYSAYFLFRLRMLQHSGLGRYVRVGAVTASVGVVSWMVVPFSLDWVVSLQSDAALGLRKTAMTFLTCIGGMFAYGALGMIVGSFYGVLAYALPRSGTLRPLQRTDIG